MAFRPHPLDLRRTLAPPGPAQSPALSDDACSVASMPPVHGREESYGQRQVASSSSSPYLDDNDDDLDLSPHSLPSQGIKTARPPLPPLPLTRRHTTSNVPTQSHVHREEHKPAYSPPTVPLARMEASDKGKERSLEPQQPRSTPSPAHPSPALVATTDDDADETTTVVSALPVYERDGDVPPVPTWPNEKEPATSQPSPPLPAPPTTSTEPQQGTQHAVERWREATAQEARRSDEAERALAPEFGRRAPSSQSTDSGRSRGYRLERGASMRHESGRRRGSGASRSAMTEAEIGEPRFLRCREEGVYLTSIPCCSSTSFPTRATASRSGAAHGRHVWPLRTTRTRSIPSLRPPRLIRRSHGSIRRRTVNFWLC